MKVKITEGHKQDTIEIIVTFPKVLSIENILKKIVLVTFFDFDYCTVISINGKSLTRAFYA